MPTVQLESLQVPLCSSVTGTCLHAHGVLFCQSEAVVHELTVTTQVDRVTVPELLLAQRRQVAGGEGPCTCEIIRDHAQHEPRCP